MITQFCQTFLADGVLVAVKTVRSEAEYIAHMRRMVAEHGDDVYTVCHEEEEGE